MRNIKNYYFETDKHLDFSEGIRIAPIESLYPEITAIAHIHSQIELLYIIKGTFDVSVNEQHFILNQGDLILFPKYAIHSATAISESGGKYYYFHIHPNIISEVAGKSKAPFFQSFFSLTSPKQKLIWRAEELKKDFLTPLTELLNECDNDSPFTFLSQKLNLCKLLLAIIRDSKERKCLDMNKLLSESSTRSAIQKAIEYINSNYASEIKATDVAQISGLSYKYFLRCFSNTIGEGFSTYLNKTRIKYAKVLLLDSTSSIHRISQAVGYNSDSYFILEFKKQTGMTPLQYAKKYRDKGVEF